MLDKQLITAGRCASVLLRYFVLVAITTKERKIVLGRLTLLLRLGVSVYWVNSLSRTIFGTQDQPCVWRRELMIKTSKTLAVMHGLRSLFLLRCRLAPKQASANRHRRRNSLRSSGLPHSKENLENRLARCLVFRDHNWELKVTLR